MALNKLAIDSINLANKRVLMRFVFYSYFTLMIIT